MTIISNLSSVVKYGDELHDEKMIVRMNELIILESQLSQNINEANIYIDNLNVLDSDSEDIKIVGSNIENIKKAVMLKQHLKTILAVDIHSLN